jgi:hypothetical protein
VTRDRNELTGGAPRVATRDDVLREAGGVARATGRPKYVSAASLAPTPGVDDSGKILTLTESGPAWMPRNWPTAMYTPWTSTVSAFVTCDGPGSFQATPFTLEQVPEPYVSGIETAGDGSLLFTAAGLYCVALWSFPSPTFIPTLQAGGGAYSLDIGWRGDTRSDNAGIGTYALFLPQPMVLTLGGMPSSLTTGYPVTWEVRGIIVPMFMAGRS